MVRYPDTLVLTWQKDGTFSSGDYTAGSTVTKTIEGRKEANGKGNLVRTQDGAQIVYDYMFFCERQEFTAPYNSGANLNSGEWTGTLKRQANHQTTTQIWL